MRIILSTFHRSFILFISYFGYGRNHVTMARICLLCLVLTFIGCHQADRQETLSLSNDQLDVAANSWTVPGGSEIEASTNSESFQDTLKLIREGEYRFEVQDLEESRKFIRNILRNSGGHVEGEELNDRSDRKVLVTRVRVPSKNFETSTSALLELGLLVHQSVNVRDVTTEWVDQSARLRSMKAMEVRYLELVKNAGKISEMLEVERELGRVRQNIESLEAQLRTLNGQVVMSSIMITCLGPLKTPDGFASKAASSLGRGGGYFLSFLLVILEVWPFVLIIVLALIGLQWNRRSMEKKRARTA
jgi:hypothetical protein